MVVDSNTGLIVGQDIIDKKLIKEPCKSQLKNSSYDLRIGRIFHWEDKPNANAGEGPTEYWLQPREAVWVLSEEEFKLPLNVTGMAYLRTTLTRQGLFAMNTGIVDPGYRGPISSVLFNFSREKVRVKVGESFFRILFVEHSDVTTFKPERDESRKRDEYEKELSQHAQNMRTKNFLDIPELDKEFYSTAASHMFRSWRDFHWKISWFIIVLIGVPLLLFWVPFLVDFVESWGKVDLREWRNEQLEIFLNFFMGLAE